MLKQLYIKNFALIDELDVNFYSGFSVITGETGAGKSIILGALGLLLGNRADTKALKEGAEKCIVEASFDISRYGFEGFFSDNDIDYADGECIIRREITAKGKSRAFINDTPVGLSIMKELGEQLIDIHSQHQNLLLQKDNFQLSVVDIIAQNQKLISEYKNAYQQYTSAVKELEATRESIEKNQQNQEFLRFQFDELEKLQLKSGEDTLLEQQANTMQHAEDIKSALFEADNHLADDSTGVIVRLHRSISAINSIANALPQASELSERLNNSYIELKDLSGEIADILEDIDYDPEELEQINSRLDAIYSMQKKHRADTIDDLLVLQEQFRTALDNIDNGDMALQELEKQVEKARKDCTTIADKLSAQRQKAVPKIQKEMAGMLKPLGLPNVRFEIQISPKDLGTDGTDRVEFLFSANPGTPLHPVSQVASGGEIARVMLSLKAMLSGAVKLPTIVFDEIDTGVSGRVAEQMAKIMHDMGQTDRQVISITHLPQIAATGSHHYKVYKEQGEGNTKSHMNELSNKERIQEIAQMLSGSTVTEAAVSNAKELLGL